MSNWLPKWASIGHWHNMSYKTNFHMLNSLCHLVFKSWKGRAWLQWADKHEIIGKPFVQQIMHLTLFHPRAKVNYAACVCPVCRLSYHYFMATTGLHCHSLRRYVLALKSFLFFNMYIKSPIALCISQLHIIFQVQGDDPIAAKLNGKILFHFNGVGSWF